MSGWTIQDSVAHYVDSTINYFGEAGVDGGSIDFCGDCKGNSTLKEGIYSHFATSQNNKVQVFIMDYRNAANAQAEFTVWVNKNAASTKETISPFSKITAVGYDVGGGLYTYGNFINYCVELQFDNYDSSSLVIPDAATFLNYYNSKIK
jgi:hypothetical protein